MRESTVVKFDCPHCGHEMEIDKKAISKDMTYEYYCENCSKPFEVYYNFLFYPEVDGSCYAGWQEEKHHD